MGAAPSSRAHYEELAHSPRRALGDGPGTVGESSPTGFLRLERVRLARGIRPRTSKHRALVLRAVARRPASIRLPDSGRGHRSGSSSSSRFHECAVDRPRCTVNAVGGTSARTQDASSGVCPFHACPEPDAPGDRAAAAPERELRAARVYEPPPGTLWASATSRRCCRPGPGGWYVDLATPTYPTVDVRDFTYA